MIEIIFDKYNLSKRNVKLILKILSDLEPLRDSSKKTLFVCKLGFFGHEFTRVLKAHECQKKPKLHTNSLNKLLFKS
jgi:hypothetical protein